MGTINRIDECAEGLRRIERCRLRAIGREKM